MLRTREEFPADWQEFRVYYVDDHGKGSSVVLAEDADAAQLHMMYAYPERDFRFALQPAH